MTHDTEAEVLEEVTKWLKTLKHLGIKPIRICDRYSKGYSDLFICVKGRFVVAELKTSVGEASQHQIDFIKEMKEAGAIGGVCRNIQDVAALVRQALREAKNV
jgi:hypothetical protein